MKLLADGGNNELLLRPPSLMVNDSQRAACMSLMPYSVWVRLSPRVAHRAHAVRSNGGQRHVLTDKPLLSQPLLNDDSAAARIGSDSGPG